MHDIVRRGDKLKTFANAPGGSLTRGAKDPGDFFPLTTPTYDPLNGSQHLRVTGFGAGAAGQGQRQIVRANKDPVQPVGGKDCIQVRQPITGFDHCQGQYFVVGVLRIIRATVEQPPGRAKGAVAQRRIAAGGHKTASLFGRGDHRADNAVGTRIQHAHDLRRIVILHPHQRHRRGSGEGLQHGERAGEVNHAVLKIDGDGIKTLMAGDLRAVARRDGQPAVNHGAAVGHCLESVFTHLNTPGSSDVAGEQPHPALPAG